MDIKTAERLSAAICAAKSIPDPSGLLKIEVCGTWCWVTGTEKVAGAGSSLKMLGFYFSMMKHAYFFKGEGKKQFRKKTASLPWIRAHYGSMEAESALSFVASKVAA